MNTNELLRYRRKQGVTLERNRGKGGHIQAISKRGTAIIPTHGNRKEMKTGTIAGICKRLGVPKP